MRKGKGFSDEQLELRALIQQMKDIAEDLHATSQKLESQVQKLKDKAAGVQDATDN